MQKACFLDRDGVLIADKDYLSDPEKVELIPGITEALDLLRKAGYLCVVVSNQSGVARGIFAEETIAAVTARIEQLLSEQGSKVDAFYYCPHLEDGSVAPFNVRCKCRKPKPGMLLQAAAEHGIDLTESFMIGDKVSDVQCAVVAGLACGILVQTGQGMEQARQAVADTVICPDALAAVEWYLAKLQREKRC